MKKGRILTGLLLIWLAFALCVPVQAATVTYKWKSVGNGDMQCYKNGKTLLKNQWIGDRHVDRYGYMDRNRWVAKKVNGELRSVFVGDNGKWIRKFKEGWRKINGEYYYYTAQGALRRGWIIIDGDKYYVDPSTETRVKGLYTIKGVQYFFGAGGVMKKNTTIIYHGREYEIDENGVCTAVRSPDAPSEEMLFFLQFESGSEAYAQTGGDNGNACGAYQFDNRYSLLPFVKYAYKENRTLCKEFKTYASYSRGTLLKSNKGFFSAWKKVYARDPQLFAELQDTYAKKTYYDPVEASLKKAGINLASRPDTLKGAVYSYSIQHGQTTAVNAVRACGIRKTTSDRDFLKKLYSYRMKKFPRYKTRYYSEYRVALSTLQKELKKAQQ